MGFPIQKSPDQSLLGGSPRLFAAFHVFLRRPMPRHPPFALNILVTNLAKELFRLNRNVDLKIVFSYSIQLSENCKGTNRILDPAGLAPMSL